MSALPFVLAPSGAVALYWFALAISTPNTSSEWLVVVALAPLVAGVAWTAIRSRSVVRTALVATMLAGVTFVLWWACLVGRGPDRRVGLPGRRA